MSRTSSPASGVTGSCCISDESHIHVVSERKKKFDVPPLARSLPLTVVKDDRRRLRGCYLLAFTHGPSVLEGPGNDN